MSTAASSVQRQGSNMSGPSATHNLSQGSPSSQEKQDVEAHGSKQVAADGPRLGQESFWSPRIKQQRQAYLKVIGSSLLLICIFVWAVIAIYWGSVWKELDLSPNLNGWIVNRDGGEIGNTVQSALIAANTGDKPHITWSVVDASRFATQDDLDFEVTNSMTTWIVVDIAQGSTTALQQARVNGDASWNPLSVVSLTYATARNFQVIPAVVTGPATKTLNQALAQFAASSAREYLSSVSSNATAITALANAPVTIAQPIVLNNRDLRPYDVSVAIALLVVGLIYLCILAFNVTMAGMGARMPLQPFLRFRSLVALRILAPLVCYMFMSLMITLLNVPFEVPYGRTFTYGAGFMIWWATTFVGMAVLGLVTECALSLVGPKFIAFALLFWIIINVSVANLPLEVSPSFYKYGVIMPFYNIRLVYVKVIFDVGERVDIIKYVGILFAWLLVIFLTFPIWIWLEVRSATKARQKQQPQGGKPSS